MSKVWCNVFQVTATNDQGYDVDAVCAECTKCGMKSDEIYGTDDSSTKRALTNLREHCKLNEKNFYLESKRK